MDLKTFRNKVYALARLASLTREDLANQLGIHPDVLSHKMNGSNRYALNYLEIKGLIKALIEASAITDQAQLLELLQPLELRFSFFSKEEWLSPPLNSLEQLPGTGKYGHSQKHLPLSYQITTHSPSRSSSQLSIVNNVSGGESEFQKISHPHNELNLATLPRDSLTQFYSQEAFHFVYHSLLEDITAGKQPCQTSSLLLIDLDNFKRINDIYGHATGDLVLQQIACQIKAVVRKDDLVFRYGGDEFVVILPGAPKEVALNQAELLLNFFRLNKFKPKPEISLYASLSIGLASFPQDSEVFNQLFKIADERLLQAKRQGRNCIVSNIETGRASYSAPALPFEHFSRLLEREELVAKYLEFVEQVAINHRGKPEIIEIRGPRESGKTAFLKEIKELSQLRGYHIRELRNNSKLIDFTIPPFHHAQDYQTASAEVARQNQIVPESKITPPSCAKEKDFLGSLSELIREVGEKGLLILLADDLDAWDSVTLEILRTFLDAHLENRWVLVYSASQSAHLEQVNGKDLQPITLTLKPLSKKAMLSWLRTLLKIELPAALHDWLYQKSQGWPGLIRKILEELLEQGLIFQNQDNLWRVKEFELPLYTTGQPVDSFSYQEGKPEPLQPGPVSGKVVALPNNLPKNLTNFFGRETEINQIHHLLTVDNCRFLSLVGPGGIGKTRLALELASRLSSADKSKVSLFLDGIFFIPLETLEMSNLVLPAIINCLNIEEISGQSELALLKDYFSKKKILLILDNFEHVQVVAPELIKLLETSPGLKMVITSRETLRVSSETILNVSPLELPGKCLLDNALQDDVSWKKIKKNPAVALFLDRLKSIKAGYEPDKDELITVGKLCLLLEGLPLALELAAAQMNLFTPGQLLNQFENHEEPFRLLKNRHRDRPARHHSLETTLEWSYHLLDSWEQQFFRSLGLFNGLFELTLLQYTSGQPPELVVEWLTSLVDKSLVQVEQPENPENIISFRLFTPVREFAIKKLREVNELDMSLPQPGGD